MHFSRCVTNINSFNPTKTLGSRQTAYTLNHNAYYLYTLHIRMKNRGGDGSDEYVNGNIKTGTAIKPKGSKEPKTPCRLAPNHSILNL